MDRKVLRFEYIAMKKMYVNVHKYFSLPETYIKGRVAQ